MAKYWSRALFYKEWKSAYWISIFLTGLLLINPVFDIMASFSMIKRDVESGILAYPQFSDWFINILFTSNWWLKGYLVITVVLVLFLFNDDRQDATGNLLASMPFSRRQVIGTKWLTGALAVALPFGLVFFLLSVFYWVNIDWIDTPYGLLIQWAFLGLLFLLAFYTFLFFVQTVMGYPIAAGIIGAICSLVPWFFTAAAPPVIRELLNLAHDSPVLKVINKIHYYTWWPRIMEARMEYLPPNWDRGYYIYTHYGIKVVLLVLLIVVFYALAQLAFAKNSLEKNGQLLMFPFLEPVLIWGFAVCFALLLTGGLGLGYGAKPVPLSVHLVLWTAVGCWIAKRAVLHYQR